MKKGKRKIRILLILIMCITLFVGFAYLNKERISNSIIANINNEQKNASIVSSVDKEIAMSTSATNTSETQKGIYLSDLDWITTNNWSYNGWAGHEIQKDKNQEGVSLSLIIDGEKVTFMKGVSVHAKGQVTYDISEIARTYPRFVAKIGVDASRETNGSIKFQISASNDGTNWTELQQTGLMTGMTEAVNVDLDISEYTYLRIYVDPNGSNAADHGTIANARFVTTDFDINALAYDKIHKLEYYDEILRQYSAEENYRNNYRLILEREFVNKIGYWTIQNLADLQPEIKETLDWILSDNENLRQIIEVGETASGETFIKTIHSIYSQYKDEIKNAENGYVYQKMMIGLAGAYGTDRVASPLTFSTRVGTYDVVERFTLMKKLFDDGAFMRTEEFKTYHVQLMRYVMQDAYRPEETLWLNALSKTKSQPLNHYQYLTYRLGPNYAQSAYQDMANKEKYSTKYFLDQYNIPYGDGIIRYWMAMEFGGICWNISRVAQSVYKVNGIPAIGIYQPQHEAYLAYTEDANGNGKWGANYNIFGWGKSCTTWYGGNPYRMLFNWGAKYFADKTVTTNSAGNSAGYMVLGQAGLNQKEPFFKSLYLNLLANSYESNEEKEEIYNEALESSNLNLDSYDYLITIYKNTNRSSNEWHKLALRIIDSYTYYPQAMYDLLKVIKPYLEGPDRVDIDFREYEALELARSANASNALQYDVTQSIASVLLGKTSARLATFSFDGENAGCIVIDPSYTTYDFNLYYSLDGGTTCSEKTTSHIIQLTDEEISKITTENGIQVMMDGTPQVYTISIQKGTLPTNLYGNDLENRVIGVTLTMEWRNSPNEPWTSYSVASPDNTGDKTLEVRVGATGNNLPSDSQIFTFTEDNQSNTRKYVSVSHLSIEAYSTQSIDTARPYYAPNAIDGNEKTLWHTDFRENVLTSGNKPFITIKLDKPRYISALEFKQTKYKSNDPDYIKNAIIYVSEDGEEWIEAGRIENCPQDTELRDITFDESIYGEYVKIEMDTYNMFASLSMVNLFQDLTKNPRPTGGIGYSTTEPTKDDVVARLVNVSVSNYKILSEGGDTHTFTDNGEFTFRFIDTDTGLEGSSVAKVDWIDRIAPTVTIEYSTLSPTNKSVIATLKPSEEVTVTNNNNFSVNEDGEVLDSEGNILNGFTVDDEGSIISPNGTIIGNINQYRYEFINNGEFTFEFVDKAGNSGTAKAEVNWIDQDPPDATLHYDILDRTNKDVTVTLEFDEENVRVLNNDGKTSYTFTENGEFTFIFVDEAGNENRVTAKVDWIYKSDDITSSEYDIKDNIIRKIPLSLKPSEFRKHIQADREVVLKDKNGNILKDTTSIGTGMKAWVRERSYTFIVEADLDGNGELSITDLAKLCLHYIEDKMLTGEYFEAGDLDHNGEITTTDIAKMQLLLIGE